MKDEASTVKGEEWETEIIGQHLVFEISIALHAEDPIRKT